MNLLDGPDATIDKRLNLLLGVVVAMTIAAIIITVIAVPRILSSASDTDAIERGDRIAGCRSLFNSKLVGDADTQLDLALARLEILQGHQNKAEDDVQDANTDLLQAAAFGDEAALVPIAAQFDYLQTRAELLQVAVDRAAIDVLDRTDALEFGRSEYNALVELSNDDTDAFLAACTRTQEDG